MLIQAHMNLSSPTAAQNRINQDGVKQHKSKKRGSLERSTEERFLTSVATLTAPS